MAEYDFIKMQKKLAKYLDEDRYEHTLGVMFTCAALAMVHDCDLITAQTYKRKYLLYQNAVFLQNYEV